MKKVISTLLSVIFFGGLFLFGTDRASAEESSVFRLYPLTENNIIDEKAVNFGSLDFGEPTSYVDKAGKTQYHTHNGVDIMVPTVSKDNVIYVYPYKDSGAYVKYNNTDPKYGNTYYTKRDTYWNSFLVVYYPSLQLYVYYGHIISDLKEGSKIDTEEALGTIRESFGDSDNRTTKSDHLHLSIRTKYERTGWGYSAGVLDPDAVKLQGWLDPIEFMRGNGETLQKYLDEQTNNIESSSESTTTTSEEMPSPNLFQGIGNILKSIQNGISDFFSNFGNIVKSAFGAENGNQISATSGSDASTESATTENTSFEKPLLSSPINGSTFKESVPTLQWSSVSSPSGGQIKYYVETFDCLSPQNSGWITDTAWTPSATTAGLYNWHVKAIDLNTGKESGFGSVWQYTIDAEYPPPSKPSLSSPNNGLAFSGSVPMLQWSSVSSPSGGQIKYYVETFDCPSPQNSGWITNTTWTPNATTEGLYNWHVKAVDVNTGEESGFGSVWQYTIEVEYPPPSMPSLSSPSNGSTFTGSVPTLQWNSVPSPSGGQIKYYVETFDCPSPQNSGWITNTTWTPNATTVGLYNWHVKAIDVNTGKESGFGNVWQYTLAGEASPFNTPSLFSPTSGITVEAGTSITFSWSDTGASRYKIRFINNSGAGTTDINVNGTSFTFTPNFVGSWTWKVCEFPYTRKEGPYSIERSFTVSQKDTTNGYDTDSGIFMFALRAPSEGDLLKSPLDTGYAVPTAGGYMLKCELMEYVMITYSEYQTLQKNTSLDKMVGSSLWNIRYNSTLDSVIRLDVSKNGGGSDIYCLYSVPTQTQPAYLMYLGDAVIIFTREVKQFFISNDTEVRYTGGDDALHEQSYSETISEYLANGGFRFGFSGEYAEHYLAQVNKGIITCLWPHYAY